MAMKKDFSFDNNNFSNTINGKIQTVTSKVSKVTYTNTIEKTPPSLDLVIESNVKKNELVSLIENDNGNIVHGCNFNDSFLSKSAGSKFVDTDGLVLSRYHGIHYVTDLSHALLNFYTGTDNEGNENEIQNITIGYHDDVVHISFNSNKHYYEPCQLSGEELQETLNLNIGRHFTTHNQQVINALMTNDTNKLNELKSIENKRIIPLNEWYKMELEAGVNPEDINYADYLELSKKESEWCKKKVATDIPKNIEASGETYKDVFKNLVNQGKIKLNEAATIMLKDYNITETNEEEFNNTETNEELNGILADNSSIPDTDNTNLMGATIEDNNGNTDNTEITTYFN